MKPLTITLFIFFWFMVAIDCFLILHKQDQYRVYTKALLAPIILAALYSETQKTKHKRSRIILTLALIFCFIGDILLLNQVYSTNFVFGLLSFIVAQTFFSIFFYRLKPFTKKNILLNFITGLVLIAYVIIILYIVWNDIGKQNYEIPFVAYVLSLSSLLLTAVNTSSGYRMKKLAFTYFIPGAILFMISDSLFALNCFDLPIQNANVFIIVMYAAALYLIINGAIRIVRK